MPAEDRIARLRQVSPRARFVAAPHLPEYPAKDWTLWGNAVLETLGSPPDFLIGSMPDGREAAAALGVRYVPVDQQREIFPRPGPPVPPNPHRAVRRVAITGPESTGKSTLARKLARHFDTIYSTEYAREYVAWQNNRVEFSDAEWIARGHIASEQALARQANGLLFIDADLVMTRLYCEFLYHRVEPWVTREAERRRYDLVLVLDCDVAWEPDPQRCLETEEDRRHFRDKLIEHHVRHGHPWMLIRGDWEERFEQAVKAVSVFSSPSVV